MERPTRRLDLPAFPRSRSRPRHPGQLALSRLGRIGRLQLLVLLLQLGSLALLLRVADQVEQTPPRHRWSGGVDDQSGSAPSPRIAR
jgi:hypothetical protein